FGVGPWGQKFPTVVASWRRAWSNVIPFFAFPPAVRKVIYTTNCIESENARPLPVRRRCWKADLAGASQHHRRLEAPHARLEDRYEPIRNPLPGPLHAAAGVECFINESHTQNSGHAQT